MPNSTFERALDIATWIAVAILVAMILVFAVKYVFYLFGVSVTWLREMLQLIAAMAVGLFFGHRRGSQGGKG